MNLTFTKISLTHHTLLLTRADGTTEKVTLETKTFMPHDLIHYVYEKEAGLLNSFWGLIASGKSFADFETKEQTAEVIAINVEAAQTEMVTGILTGYLMAGISEEAVLAAAENMFSARGESVPSWITIEFLLRVKESFRKVIGHWNALGKDEPMTLVF